MAGAGGNTKNGGAFDSVAGPSTKPKHGRLTAAAATSKRKRDVTESEGENDSDISEVVFKKEKMFGVAGRAAAKKAELEIGSPDPEILSLDDYDYEREASKAMRINSPESQVRDQEEGSDEGEDAAETGGEAAKEVIEIHSQDEEESESEF